MMRASKTFIASGIRALDRRSWWFKYADIPSKVEEDVTKAIESALLRRNGNLYVLCNYTALYITHLILKKLRKEKYEADNRHLYPELLNLLRRPRQHYLYGTAFKMARY